MVSKMNIFFDRAIQKLNFSSSNLFSNNLLFATSLFGITTMYHVRSQRRLITTTSTVANSQVKPKKSSVYTRTGDNGTSMLFNGERREKTDDAFYALGETDELNAMLGIAREHCELTNNGLQDMLAEIQCRIFDIGAAVATPAASSSDSKLAYTQFPATHTIRLEEWIDLLDSQLPALTNFVIPSGGLSSTHINMARAVCRRAERACVALIKSGQTDAEVGKYLNRLSDYLFVASRFAAKVEGRKETIWKKAPST